MQQQILNAAKILQKSKNAIAFTGAGVSVESGIPPFRGDNGLWNKYDPVFLDINYFFSHPIESWKVIKEIFYDFFGQAKPNYAHIALAEMEKMGIITAVITQNIDNLHQEGGSINVIEYHGTSKNLVCLDCGKIYDKEIVNRQEVPLCDYCHGLLKPDFIFFGEAIPEPAGSTSYQYVLKSDVVLIIGTTGEVMPACNLPYYAKQNNATIIEINPEKSKFTNTITDIFLQGKAGEIMKLLMAEIQND